MKPAMEEDKWWISLGICAFACATAMDGRPNMAMILLVVAFAQPVYFATKQEADIAKRRKERNEPR
jgi:hypothetical protein